MTALRVAGLSVQIERYIDDHFPGWVACVLTDANGKRHEFSVRTAATRIPEITNR